MRNRFMGLDLIDRVTEELWTEVRDIVQEAAIKTIPKKKKCKKAKWLSEESLQVAVKRREVKSKGEKERQMIKCLPTMRETWVRSLGWEDPLEKEMAAHSSIHSWKNPMD